MRVEFLRLFASQKVLSKAPAIVLSSFGFGCAHAAHMLSLPCMLGACSKACYMPLYHDQVTDLSVKAPA